MARVGLHRGHEERGKSPAYPERVLPERMHQARYWVCQESFHEESHGIGPTPIMCRTPAASIKATRRIPVFPHKGQPIPLQGGPATLWDSSSRARPRDMRMARAASISRFLLLFARIP